MGDSVLIPVSSKIKGSTFKRDDLSMLLFQASASAGVTCFSRSGSLQEESRGSGVLPLIRTLFTLRKQRIMLNFDFPAHKFTGTDVILRKLKEELQLELPGFYLMVMQAAQQAGQLEMTQFPWHQRGKAVTQKKYFVSLGNIQLIDGRRTALSRNQYFSVASETKLFEASISLAFLALQENCTEDNLLLSGDRFERAAARIIPPGYHPGAVREIVYPSLNPYQPREVYCNLYLKQKR